MTPSAEVPSRRVRVAAEVLWRGLVLVAGLQLYWALGGTWAVHAASGGAYSDVTTGLRVQSAVMAGILVVACLVVRARAGLWRVAVSDRVVRAAMWALTAALAVAAAVNFAAATNWERFGIGPFALVLGLLALVVAGAGVDRRRFHRPQRTLPSRRREVFDDSRRPHAGALRQPDHVQA